MHVVYSRCCGLDVHKDQEVPLTSLARADAGTLSAAHA